MSIERRLDLDLVGGLRAALTGGGFVLHYQPEVDLADGSVVGMEALLRWQHPDRGLLWPGDFLSAAEAAGLLPAIGRWVFARCLDEALAWSALPGRAAAADWQLWVNVAGSQLAEPGFAEEVTALVAASGLPPNRLGIEVPERSLQCLGEGALGVLRRLRAAGLALAIDDVSTWYAALASFGDLPVDAIKLDRSFVRGVGSELEDDEIVASVIRLAHARGSYVVAEGVESWTEGARLCELGCDRAHGYLFSGPQRPEQARWMLARGFGWRPAPAAGTLSRLPVGSAPRPGG